jgi:hypothetical protein
MIFQPQWIESASNRFHPAVRLEFTGCQNHRMHATIGPLHNTERLKFDLHAPEPVVAARRNRSQFLNGNHLKVATWQPWGLRPT